MPSLNGINMIFYEPVEVPSEKPVTYLKRII